MVLLFITMTFIIISFDISYQSGTITRLAAERISRPVRQGQEIDRIVLSKAALDMGNDNFLTGVGKGNYVLNFLDYTDSKVKPTIPHNTLLGYYAEQGILGAIIFILLPGYLILKLFKSKKEKESGYFLAMIIGIAISSLSLNLENIRFMWLLIGIFIGWIQIEKDDIKKETQYIGNKTFIIIVIVLVPVFVLSYFQAARRFVIDIYAYEGGRYEKSIAIQEPGEYSIDFDIRTDNNDHRVEIYQGDDLVDILEFNNANGKISYPVELQKDVLLKFISSNDGWMRVYNATVSQGKEFKKSMQNYALLPSILQKILDKNNQLKIYMVASAKSPIIVEENLFDKIKVLEARVIKHANYSFAFEFDYECLDEIDVLYQIQMLLHYDSLTDIFPGVTQRNRITHRSTISSDIVNWQIGQVYTHRLQRLLLNDNFKLYGRFYNHPDQTYVQDSFFEIPYLLSYENQEKADLGNSDWINIHYSNSGINIQMNSNGWIESERYDLKQGKYKLIFSAYGSKLEDEYPMIQIRDSLFNEIGELYLNENMTEYAVDFNIDSDFDGLSFLFELVNYNSISGVGRRTAFAAPIYRLEQIE